MKRLERRRLGNEEEGSSLEKEERGGPIASGLGPLLPQASRYPPIVSENELGEGPQPIESNADLIEHPQLVHSIVEVAPRTEQLEQDNKFLPRRCKVRLVAKGYNHVQGIDCNDYFAPVAKTVTVRLFLAIAETRGWPLQHFDVNNTFLHGILDEVLYMEALEEYEDIIKDIWLIKGKSVTTPLPIGMKFSIDSGGALQDPSSNFHGSVYKGYSIRKHHNKDNSCFSYFMALRSIPMVQNQVSDDNVDNLDFEHGCDVDKDVGMSGDEDEIPLDSKKRKKRVVILDHLGGIIFINFVKIKFKRLDANIVVGKSKLIQKYMEPGL
ncbi:hypothetical protein Sango_0259500 [Sesamum angolense]|uniref:Reverse transcriptase Ty1/copia-type domain-containing protein n=1 Tax=Sesamum angolense TaxID=2727404 RepID=A0AAE1XHB3_9LAMI|nr:hypothetical protein Sango_0259500 [Sesamum angolense]